MKSFDSSRIIRDNLRKRVRKIRWNMVDCPFEKRQRCSAFFSNILVPSKIKRLTHVPGRKKKKVVAL